MASKMVLGIEEASFFSMSVHRLHMFILLGERAVGPRRCWRMGRSSKGGGVSVDGFVGWMVLRVLLVRLGFAWLACLRAGVV